MTSSNAQLQQLFEDCVETCADSLYRVAFRLTANQTLANELVQETYLNAWKSLETINDATRLRAWMFAIMRNQYSRLIRKESKATATRDDLDVVATHSRISGASGSEQRSEQIDAVQTAINELDEKHKLPILLISMEGMTVDEAATILELPRGTILSRLHRGRKKLKEVLLRDGVGIVPNQLGGER